jgi:uncharacterized protein YbjT (DUF2867 family)
MVGTGTLLECLDDASVRSVLVVGRNPCGVRHEKVSEAVVPDLFDLGAIRPRLADGDACFFCLGVSAVGLSEDGYRHVTYDLTLAVARSVLAAAPKSVFLYVSGEGTDSTERGRAMWARVKGKTENDLLALGFRAAYMFRPGFIQPRRGVRSRTGWYQAVYNVLGPAAPLLRRVAPSLVTTTVDVGRAMIRVARDGYSKPILRTRDINAVAALAASR